ncbi:MAG TPA: bifunctional 4-hydroxy-2-oxoglutarate aldolase/2-dehydro-3-deoxy-phosphogluconate aldolase, partial [Clostridia bacterium]|nr:bifunctional 4-hydroxy-2-oxoglutarate aldolase/2-dehydro-3-deoxy-phosphogluconate aldolase [Clostridia bacterium]
MLDQLALAGLVPVIKVERAEDAAPLCEALLRGGLPVAEITLRTPAALEAIKLVRERLPEILLGAGTVLSIEQADAAWQAGAGYLVTPGMNPALLRHALERGYPILPGCSGPTDLETALSMGVKTVKFFPAEALGGAGMIKALLGPYHEMRFVPTGGINPKNLMDYLGLPQVLACGGSWMVPEEAIRQGDWDRIEILTRDAVNLVLGFELRHLGINTADGDAGMDAARTLSLITGWPIDDLGERNCFVGQGFEIMKFMGRGRNGHLALACNSAAR